jgi:hypothetical protein
LFQTKSDDQSSDGQPQILRPARKLQDVLLPRGAVQAEKPWRRQRNAKKETRQKPTVEQEEHRFRLRGRDRSRHEDGT